MNARQVRCVCLAWGIGLIGVLAVPAEDVISPGNPTLASLADGLESADPFDAVALELDVQQLLALDIVPDEALQELDSALDTHWEQIPPKLRSEVNELFVRDAQSKLELVRTQGAEASAGEVAADWEEVHRAYMRVLDLSWGILTDSSSPLEIHCRALEHYTNVLAAQPAADRLSYVNQ